MAAPRGEVGPSQGLDESGEAQVMALFHTLERDAPKIPGKLRRFREELEEPYYMAFGDLPPTRRGQES